MADDEKKGPGPMEDALLFIGFIVILVALWLASGRDKRADIRGIFIHPPAPIGQGGAYGPAVGSSTIRNQ